MFPTKVAFITPYFRENRGNATTSKRIITGLKSLGIVVEVFAYEEEDWTESVKERLESCDIYHILHFYRFVKWQKTSHFKLLKPYVLTAGGTDINEHLYDSDFFPLMKSLIREARGVAVFTDDSKIRLKKAFKVPPRKVEVIAQSVWLPEVYNDRLALHNTNSHPKILLPAGLRPVKDVLYLFDIFNLLEKHYPKIAFNIIGPILNRDVYNKILQIEKQYTWFSYKGSVPFTEIREWYNWADIVINTSLSEGQPSALLEAMALNKPVLARKIPGNESIVNHGETGLLFESQVEFMDKLKLILENYELRQQITQQAKHYVETNHALEDEVLEYISLYRKEVEND